MRRLAAFALAFFIAFAPLAPAVAQLGTAPIGQTATPAQIVVTPPANSAVTVRDGVATVSGGTIIGEIIMWVALIIGAPLAGLVATFVVKLMQKFGIEVSDADRARLKEMIENGIALAAQRAEKSLDGKLPVEVKNQIAVRALEYVQAHGIDTLKRLGYDPTDPKAIEAIQARIAKFIAEKEASVGSVSVTTHAS